MTTYSALTTRKKRYGAGFTLIELIVSIAVLMVVMGVVFKQVNTIQGKAKTTSMKLDLNQESRAFVDQFIRDVHMSGYPIATLYSSNVGRSDHLLALGIIKATPTLLRFEGDVYGDGTVYEVWYKYVAADANDPNCPCLRRGTAPKANPDADPLAQSEPTYYTEVQSVIDPSGMAQGLFTYADASGNTVDVSGSPDIASDPDTIKKIYAIKVNLNTRSNSIDPQTGQPVVNSIAAVAELEN